MTNISKQSDEMQNKKLEEQKEEETEKLFKRLRKEFEIYLYEIIKRLVDIIYEKEGAKESDDYIRFFNDKQDDIIDFLIKRLKKQYYNDERFYCSNDEFEKLRIDYAIKYKKAIKKIVLALT